MPNEPFGQEKYVCRRLLVVHDYGVGREFALIRIGENVVNFVSREAFQKPALNAV